MADAQEDWHMEKKIIIGIITVVLINMVVSIWQGFFVLKTLDTDPPIIERIIRLEYQASEQGRVNQQILDELREAKEDRSKFMGEQSRRTSAIDWVEKQMGVR